MTVEGGYMNKKLLALLTLALVGTFCLTGCGKKQEVSTQDITELETQSEETGTEEAETMLTTIWLEQKKIHGRL